MVKEQKSCWKLKERTAAKGSGKMVSYHVTIIPLNVFYMFKVTWISSLFTGNPKKQRSPKIYSQWGGDESTHQKKATYSYFIFGICHQYTKVFTLKSNILTFQNICVAISQPWLIKANFYQMLIMYYSLGVKCIKSFNTAQTLGSRKLISPFYS